MYRHFSNKKPTKKQRAYARKKYQKKYHKAIKKNHPDWKRKTKKEKKRLAKDVMDYVINNYDYSKHLDMPIEELTGIDGQMPLAGIIPLPAMADYIENFYSNNILCFNKRKKPYPEIFDPELKFIDELLDDHIINSLIAPEGYSPAHRLIQPSQLLRMELLKILKYPEISYRKFCTEEYFGEERKQNRSFVGLPLNSDNMIDHTQLSHFRLSLHFIDVVNLLVYILHYTLTAINPSTGHSFPLISIVAAANHHDSLFLKPLIILAQAIGIDMKLVTADQAYHDNDGSVLAETGVHVVAPPCAKVKLPDNVLESPVRVTCNDFCEIPMQH